MNSRQYKLIMAALAAALLGVPAVASGQAAFDWQTVANNGTVIPGTADRTFNSYNDPSVNSYGLVVFRARSTGRQAGPIRGIFARDMVEGLPLVNVYLAQTEVPYPNDADYNGNFAVFNEFPSFARVDAGSPTIVTRGQSQPVMANPENDERIGTSGIYVEYREERLTAMTQLGAIPGFEYFSVPDTLAPLYTRFEQFPGAPSVMDRETIAFKGNFSVGEDGFTGVYFRNFRRNGGMAPVSLVASSLTTNIPGTSTPFGSTAPPSAADGYMVFVGLDNEESPTQGGIYRASVRRPTALEALVTIGTQVPGEERGVTFTRFGESLALGDQARFIAFWAAWKDRTDYYVASLHCPAEGNKGVIAYCNTQCNDGGPGVCRMNLPVYQGIFVYDSKSRSVVPVAKTGDDIDTFLYCKFSGRAPGPAGGGGGSGSGSGGSGGSGNGGGPAGGHGDAGDAGHGGEDGEMARWRCGAYAALASRGVAYYQVAYKAVRNDVTGLYLWDSRPKKPLQTVLETGMDASVLDPAAAGSSIASIGIERDGFRAGWMAITASSLAGSEAESSQGGAGEDGDEAEGWAGIYLARVPGWSDLDE